MAAAWEPTTATFLPAPSGRSESLLRRRTRPCAAASWTSSCAAVVLIESSPSCAYCCVLGSSKRPNRNFHKNERLSARSIVDSSTVPAARLLFKPPCWNCGKFNEVTESWR